MARPQQNKRVSIKLVSNGLAGGIVYNRKIVGGEVVSLHFHLPLFLLQDRLPDESRFDLSEADTSRVSAFITPGLQIRFLDPFFLQPYVFGGGGLRANG